MRTPEAAAAAGVNPQTLRYYERRKLLGLRGADRAIATTGPGAVRTVRFVKRAQALGFDFGRREHEADR